MLKYLLIFISGKGGSLAKVGYTVPLTTGHQMKKVIRYSVRESESMITESGTILADCTRNCYCDSVLFSKCFNEGMNHKGGPLVPS